MLNGIIDSQKVRARKATASSQSSGSSFVPRRRKTNSGLKCLRRVWGNGTKKWSGRTKQWGSGTSTTLKPLLSSRRCFRLVELTISFAIEHLAILSKLIYCTCIANGVAARTSNAAVPTSPTTSLRVVSWSSGMFHIIWIFQVLHLDLFWCSSIDAGFPYTIVGSITAEWAPRHAER
jgi:hypothetical protein